MTTNINGHFAKVAVVVQLPDGQIITQWGYSASVTMTSELASFVPGQLDTFPVYERTTQICWDQGFRMTKGTPSWDEPEPNTPALPEPPREIES